MNQSLRLGTSQSSNVPLRTQPLVERSRSPISEGARLPAAFAIQRYFVLAPGLHGATLLARLLDSHPEVVSLGDAYPRNHYDQVCGCGERVSTCPFWQTVKLRVGASSYRRLPLMLPLYPEIKKGGFDHHLYNLMPPKMLARVVEKESSKRFVSDYEDYLSAVFGLVQKPSARIFVDGVKSTQRVKAMIALDQPVNGIIHLVRNIGDYVKSVQKQEGGSLATTAKRALHWRVFHRRVRDLGRTVPYIRVSYEDLTANPDEELARLFAFMAVQPLSLSELLVRMSKPWHFMGNAALFGFDGQIARRKYHLSTSERLVLKMFA